MKRPYGENAHQYANHLRPYADNLRPYGVNGGQYADNGDQYGANGRQYGDNGDQYGNNGGQYANNGGQHGNNGGQYGENGDQDAKNLHQYDKNSRLTPIRGTQVESPHHPGTSPGVTPRSRLRSEVPAEGLEGRRRGNLAPLKRAAPLDCCDPSQLFRAEAEIQGRHPPGLARLRQGAPCKARVPGSERSARARLAALPGYKSVCDIFAVIRIRKGPSLQELPDDEPGVTHRELLCDIDGNSAR